MPLISAWDLTFVAAQKVWGDEGKKTSFRPQDLCETQASFQPRVFGTHCDLPPVAP